MSGIRLLDRVDGKGSDRVDAEPVDLLKCIFHMYGHANINYCVFTMANWIQLMGFLLVLSVWSLAIIIDRRQVFRRELSEFSMDDLKKLISSKNWEALRSWAESRKDYIGGAILAALGADSTRAESVERAMQSYFTEQKLKLEKGLNLLATLAANAAFIGLLGTVMGIIQSFGILSSQQGSAMNAVMFGLAEALVATAIGIFVAVPAAIAYNLFSQRLRNAQLSASAARDLYLSRLES
jgi:biopolymer transport protein ExbB/TolQ